VNLRELLVISARSPTRTLPIYFFYAAAGRPTDRCVLFLF